MDVLRRARDLYQRGQMHDALEVAQAACERQPKDAEAWWLLGCVSRYNEMPAASDSAFRRAAELNRHKSPPHRLPAADFEALVRSALGGLSPDALRRLGQTRVEVAPLPSPDALGSGVAPDALSRRQRGADDVLTVYQINHENRSPTGDALRGLVDRTLSRA